MSGQTFEWNYDKSADLWTGNIYGNLLKIKQIGYKDSGHLEYESEKELEKEITNYFSLDLDYDFLIRQIVFDKYIQATMQNLYGLRIIRQDPWYCINSFILSSNNTVKNIQNILTNISKKYSTNTIFFPSFEIVKKITVEELRECKAGFRAQYLKNFYNELEKESQFIEILKSLDYESTKNKLKYIKGIGEKIADCILLYSFDKYEAYPIDTHLRQITLDCYFASEEKKPTDKELRIWAKNYWGNMAGFAHFFLFTHHRLYGEIKI